MTNRAQQAANRKITMRLKRAGLGCEGDGIRRDRDGLTRCRVCGCTQVDACAGGGGWVPGEADLWTTCAEAVAALVLWLDQARRANRAALWREAIRQQAL